MPTRRRDGPEVHVLDLEDIELDTGFPTGERIAKDAVPGKLTSDRRQAATAPRSCASGVISSGAPVGGGWIAEGGCGHR